MEILNLIYEKINLQNLFGNSTINIKNKSNLYDIENIIKIPIYTHRIYKKNINLNLNFTNFIDDETNNKIYPDIKITINENTDINDTELNDNLLNSIDPSVIPINCYYSGINNIEWCRQNYNSDYIVKYEGINYTINYNIIEKIHLQTNINIEEILKTFIHNNFDENITLCQLLV